MKKETYSKDTEDTRISESLFHLNMLAKKLTKQRKDRGALTLASPEVRFKLESDSQDPVDVEMKELRETNALVEEFMLLANCWVARKIYGHFSASALLRSHPPPSPSQLESLARVLERHGVHLDATATSKTLSQTLDAAVRPEEPYFNQLVRILTTRCMMQAIYVCSGTVPPTAYHHYGLAIDLYTHFTSPIRRYAGRSSYHVGRQSGLMLIHSRLFPKQTRLIERFYFFDQ
jgi:exosome complex exonuclease DIS3/RRP44